MSCARNERQSFDAQTAVTTCHAFAGVRVVHNAGGASSSVRRDLVSSSAAAVVSASCASAAFASVRRSCFRKARTVRRVLDRFVAVGIGPILPFRLRSAVDWLFFSSVSEEI